MERGSLLALKANFIAQLLVFCVGHSNLNPINAANQNKDVVVDAYTQREQ